MELVVLGAGWGSPGLGTAYALQFGDGRVVLVDCGPATTARMAEAGIDINAVDQVLLTHHHFDHVADVPALLLGRWVGAFRPSPRRLGIAGPAPTADVVASMLTQEVSPLRLDWQARVGYDASHGRARAGERFEDRLPLDVRDVAPDDVVEHAGFRAVAGPADHVQPWLASVSWRVEAPEASVLFTGDTRATPELAAFAAGADCVVAMCWDHEERVAADGRLAPIVMGTTTAARLAAEAAVPMLIVSHFGPSFDAGQQELAHEEMSAVYSGRIVFGRVADRVAVGV